MWTERGPMVSTNDSIHRPSPWSTKGPSHSEEEGKPINISLGYEVLLLCMGPAELYITLADKRASVLPRKKDFLHCLDYLLPFLFMRTMLILLKLQGKDKEYYAKGLLIKTLNILLFIGTNVKPNQEN